ncbi:bifunctional diguanylate cyclase/phosphodiesterase [Acidobacteria bacterium ACD]|nr:MAG: bifunctional diguanylate cyclase/phosphodiesterase [Acidobacteriota bacterium]MDL1950433.1 bifunctional diguanylate cyclase/phosphodiesterase [Acidobacteria bacterium ACD]
MNRRRFPHRGRRSRSGEVVSRAVLLEESLALALLDESPDPAALVDTTGRVLSVNRAARAAGASADPDAAAAPERVPPFWAGVAERERLLALALGPDGSRNEAATFPEGEEAAGSWLVSGRALREPPESARVLLVARAAPPPQAPAPCERDAVTGFLLREPFRRALDALVESASGGPIALIALDLDDFKALNDTHGLAAGDEYLRRFADLLRERAGPEALIARLGGDEFAVLLPGEPVAEAGRHAERIVEATSRLVPVYDGRTLSVSATAGVAVFPDHAPRSTDLLLVADLAMHQAKQRGRGRVQIHDPAVRERDRIGILRGQADRVRVAIAEGRILPFFQPIAEVASGRVVAVETLARIQEEDGYVTSPEGFLVAAERFGLVTAIDKVVIEKAFEALSQHRRRAGVDLEMSLNLSGLDFEDDGLVGEISRLARARGIRPDRVTFEITETAALRDLARVKNFTAALRAEGFRFALDDFGVGFSSFRYLRELPMSTLKLDMSYVRTLPSVMENRVFVRGIAEICRGYGVKTVAEGVESKEILALLRELGVDRAQGFQIGRPSPDLPTPPRDRPASGAFPPVPV